MATPAPLAPPRAGQMIQRNKTYQDFLRAVEAHPQHRVEFIDGDILMTPAPVPYHQIISANLFALLREYVRQHKLGLVLFAPLDVELAPEQRIVQPDLVFIAAERVAALVGETRLTGAPDLVVEVLSPATAATDRHRKLPLYAAAGVAEYWIVDPDNHAVEVYTLDGDTYRVAGIHLAGETIQAGQFAPAQIQVDAIFNQ